MLVFVLSIIAFFAARSNTFYHPENKWKKYINVNNSFFNTIFVSKYDVFLKQYSLKKDKSKMAIIGIPCYVLYVILLIVITLIYFSYDGRILEDFENYGRASLINSNIDLLVVGIYLFFIFSSMILAFINRIKLFKMFDKILYMVVLSVFLIISIVIILLVII